MASNTTAAQITEAHRREQVSIKARATRLALEVWPLLDPSDAAAFQQWAEANMTIIDVTSAESVAAARDYFVAYSAAETGARYRPPPAPGPIDRGRIAGTLFATGPEKIAELLRAGKTPMRAAETARTISSGAAAYLSLEPHREMLAETPAQDFGANRAPAGWARVTSSKPCAFCAMLASRGGAYRERGTANFQAHPHCACTVEPVYNPDADLPGPAGKFRKMWEEATDVKVPDTSGMSFTDQIEAIEKAYGGRVRGTSNDAFNDFRNFYEKQLRES